MGQVDINVLCEMLQYDWGRVIYGSTDMYIGKVNIRVYEYIGK